MDFATSHASPETIDTDCLLAPVYANADLPQGTAAIDKATGGRIQALLESGDFTGEAESVLMLHELPSVTARRVLLLGCGAPDAFDPRRWRSVAKAGASRLERSPAEHAAITLTGLNLLGGDTTQIVRALVQALGSAHYRFDELKSEPETSRPPLRSLVLQTADPTSPNALTDAASQADAISAGVTLARDLANRPGNVCTPQHLAEQAETLAREFPTIHTEILDEDAMRQLGMGALLAVSQGSRQPPRLIAMDYRAGGKNDRPIVLVGKGVTFDTGGISIKPAAAMDEMKFDMGGAASVFGVMRACAQLQLPLNVVGVVPAVENMPDGNAYRPGDVLTSMSGRTIEVLNTDAEGRLILCDALTWAERYKPDAIIDIATLTGACITALGHHAAALLTHSESMAEALARAGETSGDRCWRLPLWDEYQEQLKSPFADMANVGGPPAGTITAACFLSRFTQAYPHWAHLDIAGVAWNRGEHKGATGRPVPLLVQYLLDRAAA